MHHNGCDNYHKFLVFDIQTSLICACVSQYYYKCMFSDYQRYSVWLRIRIGIYFYISSCPAATTRLGLVLPMEHFSSPSQPLGPVQCKKVKHWGTGVQHKLLTVLSVFHKKMHLNCFSICDRMRQKLLLPVWLANACVITLNPADLLFLVSSPH